MRGRYELVNLDRPEWRGQRFTTLPRARAALAQAYPPQRWRIWDRLELEWRKP
jgi:hypothetical protein